MTERRFRYIDVAAGIRAGIVSGEHVIGSVLPSEAALADEHGVSRVTVRRALEHLRSEGLVDSRQGSGWFVGAAPVPQTLDALDAFEHQLTEAGITSRRQVLSFGFVPTPQPAADLFDADQVLEVVRLNLADEAPFAVVTVWCREDLAQSLSRRDVESQTFLELLDTEIGSATQTIGAVNADDQLAATLGLPVGAALLRIWRVTRSTDGDVVLASEHFYPAHRTEFSVTLGIDAGRAGESATVLRLVRD